jgi:drug/metabolite transporter (DMT)-like permease
MAVPLVGVLSATAVVGEMPHATDWVAAAFIAAAIASATWRRSDNARR